jgi:hypothetical protein
MKALRYIFYFISFGAMAQTGIGTTIPHVSAKLEVNASNKGFLPPRVTLSSVTDASTIPSPAVGLMVYHVGSAGLQAGYYYWNGANWATIATATLFGNAVLANDMVKLYGEAHSKASGKIGNSTTGFVFTVPVSRRYLFDFTSSATVINGGTNTIYFTVRQGSTVLGSDMQSSYNNNVHVEYNGKVEVNLQTGVSYNVYNYATSGSFESNEFDRVYYKLVAGNLPVNQHIAERNIQLNNNFLSNDGGNEGIRIDNSGNVGINNSAPSQALDVTGTGRFSTSLINSGARTYLGKDGGNMHWLATTDAIAEGNNLAYGFEYNGSSIQSHRWMIGGTERMKINSNGNLGIGTGSPIRKLHVLTSDATSVYVESTTSDNNGMFVLNANTNQNWANGWHEFMLFQNQGSTIGQIVQTNASTISYNTTSDYRLKTDFKPFNGMELVRKIKTYDYTWKTDQSRMYGMKAHELKEVIPYLVAGVKDAVDSSGKIIPQTVDYSKLTPILVKAMQEQDEQIRQLTKEKENLENRIKTLERLILTNNKDE